MILLDSIPQIDACEGKQDHCQARQVDEQPPDEVARATREDIRINIFMLDPNSYLRGFVEKMTQMNGGRAFFTSPHNLGDYVLVDFLENRRRLSASGGRRV